MCDFLSLTTGSKGLAGLCSPYQTRCPASEWKFLGNSCSWEPLTAHPLTPHPPTSPAHMQVYFPQCGSETLSGGFGWGALIHFDSVLFHSYPFPGLSSPALVLWVHKKTGAFFLVHLSRPISCTWAACHLTLNECCSRGKWNARSWSLFLPPDYTSTVSGKRLDCYCQFDSLSSVSGSSPGSLTLVGVLFIFMIYRWAVSFFFQFPKRRKEKQIFKNWMKVKKYLVTQLIKMSFQYTKVSS